MTGTEVLCTICVERKAQHGVAVDAHDDSGGLRCPARYDKLCDKCWEETEMYKQLKQKGALQHGEQSG